jgi:hypothetical protein
MRFEKKINEYDLKIKELQNICTHPSATKVYNGDGGSYYEPDGRYWIDWTCPDCGKKWMTDQ